MDTNPDDTIARYTALLKAKVSHLSAMSAEQRVALQQQFAALAEDVSNAGDDDPGGPAAQRLLERWASLMEAMSGTEARRFIERGGDVAEFRATPELRDELWARRAEWLPADRRDRAAEPVNVEQVRAEVRDRLEAFGGRSFLEFMKRARAARR